MKMFDFQCECGHKQEELYRSDETIPDQLPCEKCGGTMNRVKLYPVPGVMLPSAPASYNQGY